MDKPFLRRLQSRGEVSLLLLMAVVAGLAALIGGSAAVVIINRSSGCASIMERIDRNDPTLTQAEIDRCRTALKDQLEVAVASGNFVNAVDPVPNAGNAATQFGSGATSNFVDRASRPTPTSGGTLPLDAQGQGGNPQCSAAGVYTCRSGQRICRDKVCNSTKDCADGSDESPIINCAQQTSCCITTNGCPGETATSCAATCCCCPYGQKCSTNHSAGCVNSP